MLSWSMANRMVLYSFVATETRISYNSVFSRRLTNFVVMTRSVRTMLSLLLFYTAKVTNKIQSCNRRHEKKHAA